ncbi:MAG: hypothetical protein GOVbin568_5 [Prokaryotic dsDNA virus sp.]|nr:MAG: hypothetical protein GOVbin568_5 [Prokaryotic dsDNA virus sp.]|tara:strand:- start:1196 stop:1972 length:777 start_codon:yes stop_codon:yes gene_type:complete
MFLAPRLLKLQTKVKTPTGFSISNLDGLVTWFKFNTNISVADQDSDGDADISWTSSHTDGRNARQNVDAQEPSTTGGYIQFSGLTGSDADNLDISSDIELNEFVIFLALDLDVFTNETIIGNRTNAHDFLRFGFQNLANKARFRRTSSSYNDDFVMSEDMTSGTPNLMTIRCFNNGSSTTVQIRRATKSGSTITTNQVCEEIGSTFAFDQTLTLNTIGVQTTNSAPMEGKLYEFVVFSGTLSDANIALIEADILNRVA